MIKNAHIPGLKEAFSVLKTDLKEHKNFFWASIVILFLSFTVNIFGVISNNTFFHGNDGTAALTNNQIICKGRAHGGFMLSNWDGSANRTTETCNPSEVTPYYSQYGLMTRVYAFVYSAVTTFWNLDAQKFIVGVHLFTALFSASIIGLIALWFRSRLGVVAGVVLVALLANSTYLVYGTNIRVDTPLVMLPLLFGLYFFRIASGYKYQIFFWTTLGTLLCLRFLSGYTLLSTFVIMIMSVISYQLYLERRRPIDYVKYFSYTLAVAMVSFFIAMSINIFSLVQLGNSASHSFALIKDKAEKRSLDINYGSTSSPSIYRFKQTLPVEYEILNNYVGLDSRQSSRSLFWDNFISIINYLLLPIASIPLLIKQPLTDMLSSFLLFLVLVVYLYKSRKKWVEKRDMRQIEAMYVAMCVGIVGYMSWQILARNHALIHPHLDALGMYMPLGFFGFAVIGKRIERFIRTHRK